MRTRIITLLLLGATGTAYAQLGDILRKIDPSKVTKSVKVAREASRDFTEGEEADIGRVVSARILSTYPLAKDDIRHIEATFRKWPRRRSSAPIPS